jgi:hypothetical protein
LALFVGVDARTVECEPPFTSLAAGPEAARAGNATLLEEVLPEWMRAAGPSGAGWPLLETPWKRSRRGRIPEHMKSTA